MPGTPKSIRDYAMNRVMSRAGATRPSANQITLLRDADGDGVPEVREVFMSGLSQPFGMALVGSTLYIGNTDSVMAFPYETGQTRITAPGRKLMSMKPGGHWTRNIIASADGTKLYVAVGSLSNIAESGMEVEEGRACIFELDLKTEQHRIFAGGLRNPVGMAWEPTNGSLWTVVNERDGLGDETPPDYLTSVKDGGFYGWPFCYWGQTVDDRVPQDAAQGRQRRDARLCAGRPHRFARSLLAAGKHAARPALRHGHRPARLVEPQQAQWLSRRAGAVQQRQAAGHADRPADRVPGRGREDVQWSPGRRGGGQGWRIAGRG